LDDIRTNSEQALLAAQTTERVAATTYAQAVVIGNSELEKAAIIGLQKAAKQLNIALDTDRRQQMVISALQAEIDGVEAKIDDAKNRNDDATSQAL